MIKQVRNIKVHQDGSLPIEEYHARHGISSSYLYQLSQYCPAKYRYGERDDSPALEFGVASHACMLEPDKFKAEFIRDINPLDDETILTSASAVKKALKDLGVNVLTSFKADEVFELARERGDEIKVLANMQADLRQANPGKVFVKPDDFDALMKMRDALFGTKYIADILEGAFVETSIICDIMIDGYEGWITVKVRPDLITKSCLVPDYKTTRDVRPQEFARLASNAGYWFRQVFTCDVLSAVYGTPFYPALIAQEKDAPYIPQLYTMTNGEKIERSRAQYLETLIQYANCLERDSWPAYADGPLELGVPAWDK